MTSMLEALNQALHCALAQDSRVVLLGQDLLDPYGGAFKVTRGLSSAYPQRVLTTPISEAGVMGLAAGMALRGLRPVVEIMFGDFVTLAADQLINHIAKYRWMYNDQVRVPLVLRTPMGGRRGYGPTHSQTLEKHLLGAPGLRVVAPSPYDDPGGLLLAAIADDDPVLFIENKLLYLLPVQPLESGSEFTIEKLPAGAEELTGSAAGLRLAPYAPAYRLQVTGAPPPTVTIAAYGYMAELARRAIQTLAYQHEVFAEVIVVTGLAPFDAEPLLAALRRTGRLLAVEEGSRSFGWGAEVLARASEALGGRLRHAARLAAAETPIPASGPLEAAALPGEPEIVAAVLASLAE